MDRKQHNHPTNEDTTKKIQTFNGFYSIEDECETIPYFFTIQQTREKTMHEPQIFPSFKIEFSIDSLLLEFYADFGIVLD